MWCRIILRKETAMKIAVTFDNGNVWQHFGRTENFKFYDVAGGKVVASEVLSTDGQGHAALAGFLKEHGADVVICGGVGAPMIGHLSENGIKAVPGVTGEADKAVEEYLAGTLQGDEAAVHAGCHHHE